MLPCPFPRELPLYSIRQTRRPPMSYRTAAGGHCYAPVPVPEPRLIFASRRLLERLGFPQETPRTRALSLGLVSGQKFSQLLASIGRPGLTIDAIRTSRRQTGGPYTSHCRGPVSSDTRTAPQVARRFGAYALRPGVGSAVKSGARPSEALLPFVSFLLSLPDRQRIRPRSHSKGSTLFIARARFWEGCLDVDALLQLQFSPAS
jgi:hypothetical protein